MHLNIRASLHQNKVPRNEDHSIPLSLLIYLRHSTSRQLPGGPGGILTLVSDDFELADGLPGRVGP